MGSKRLNITVPEADYDDWETAVEEDNVASSYSELIRNAVRMYLDGNLSHDTETTQTPAQAGPSEEVLSSLNGLESGLTEVQQRLERIESQQRTEGLPEGIDWRELVLETLPTTDDAETTQNPSPEDYGVTAEEYSNRLKIDRDDAESLLERVQAQTGMVRSATGGPSGVTYWWRDG